MSGSFTPVHCERFWCHLASSVEKCTLSFNPVPKIPKIISCETPYSSFSCFPFYYMWLCAPSSVYCPCVMRQGTEETPCFNVITCPEPTWMVPTVVFPTHSVENYLLGLLGTIKYGVSSPTQRYGKTSSAVPPCVFLLPSMSSHLIQPDSCAFTFSVISTSEFNHKLGSHVKEKNIHPVLM